MPNWVHHHLTITGPAEERERFLQECFTASGEGPELDFNKLIPMPEDVKASTKEPGPCFPAHSLWYDWCCDNWGTKWNASGGGITKEGDSLYLSFDTAWAPPEPIFHEIATRYPSLSFAGNILEEMGHFEAVIRCQGGKVEYDVTRPAKWREPEDEARQIDEQHEAIELMAELKGQDHDDIPF